MRLWHGFLPFGGGGVENEECYITLEGYFPAGSFIAFTAVGPLPFGGVRITPVLNYFPEKTDFSNMFSILKNSPFFIGGIIEDCVAEGSIVAGTSNQEGYYSFWVTGDCKITV